MNTHDNNINTKFNIMNPHIEIKPYPINAAIDDIFLVNLLVSK